MEGVCVCVLYMQCVSPRWRMFIVVYSRCSVHHPDVGCLWLCILDAVCITQMEGVYDCVFWMQCVSPRCRVFVIVYSGCSVYHPDVGCLWLCILDAVCITQMEEAIPRCTFHLSCLVAGPDRLMFCYTAAVEYQTQGSTTQQPTPGLSSCHEWMKSATNCLEFQHFVFISFSLWSRIFSLNTNLPQGTDVFVAIADIFEALWNQLILESGTEPWQILKSWISEKTFQIRWCKTSVRLLLSLRMKLP